MCSELFRHHSSFILFLKIEMVKKTYTQKNINRYAQALKEGKLEQLMFKYLYADILDGNFSEVKRGLKEIKDLTQTLKDGRTLMHAAASGKGGYKMCELLDEAGVSALINNFAKDGKTPLHDALSFETGCDSKKRNLVFWFLTKSILYPFPDSTSIGNHLQQELDNVSANMIFENQETFWNENETAEENEVNANTQSVGNNLIENAYYVEDTSGANLKTSRQHLYFLSKYANHLEKKFVRPVTFEFLQGIDFEIQRTTVYNVDWNLKCDIRMTVKTLKELVKRILGIKQATFSLQTKLRGKIIEMNDSKRLGQYNIQKNTKLMVVQAVQTGQGRTRRNRRS
jgi:hypothetical protein